MIVGFKKSTQFTRALRSKSFALLWTGQTISALGDGAFLTAMAWQVLILTGSATAMGVILFAEMLPKILFLLVGGVIADRLPRRQVLLWSDAGRGIIVGLIALLGLLHLLVFWHLLVLAILFGIIGSFFSPAYQAIPPQLVPTENLTSANALTGLSQQMGFFVGPMIGASLVALVSTAGAFAFDGITFIISAICLLSLRLPSASSASPAREVLEDKAEAETPTNPVQALFKDIGEGINYVKSVPWLWVSILVASVGNVGFAGTINVALPKLVSNVYHSGAWLLGVILVAGAGGSIVATLIVGYIQKLRHRGMIAYLALFLSSIAVMILGVPLPGAGQPIIASAANVLVEFGIGIFGIIFLTLLQELIPEDKLGRVSSIEMAGSFLLLPIGYVLVGVLTDHIGPGWTFIIGGILNFVLVAIALSIRSIRQLD